MEKRTVQLRSLTWQHVINETPFHELPVEWTGSSDNASKFAEAAGYKWKVSRRYIFGGYWVNPTSGAVLYPT